jgi:threonine aldolase
MMAHVARGQEVIAGRETHTVGDEAAGHAVVVGASVRQMRDRADGTIDLDELEEAFRDPTDPHEPPTGLVILENAHSHSMNQPLTPAYMASVAAIAHRHGVPLHVDGARFFNASVALGIPPRELAAAADSVTFCLSKGLACPVGSVIVGERAFADRARRARKLLGGGMRQAGIVAAAGLVALQDGAAGMIERLADDHANARRLAEGLASLPGIRSAGGIAQPTEGDLDPERVATNFVLFQVAGDRLRFLEALRGHGVLMERYPHGQIRAVTHYGIGPDEVEATIAAVRAVLDQIDERASGAVHAGRPGA